MSRRLKTTGLFCRIWSLFLSSVAKETYDFKEPTTRSHPISEDLLASMTVDTKHAVSRFIGKVVFICL